MNFNDYTNILDTYYSPDCFFNSFGYRIPISRLFSVGNGIYHNEGSGYKVTIYPNSMIYGL